MRIPAWLFWLTGGIAVAGMVGWFGAALNQSFGVADWCARLVAPAIVVFFVLLLVERPKKSREAKK